MTRRTLAAAIRHRAAAAAAALALLAACAPPEAERITASPQAMQSPAPDLLPAGDFTRAAAGGSGAQALAEGSDALAARAQALRDRARGLDGPVLDPGARPRLEAAGTVSEN